MSFNRAVSYTKCRSHSCKVNFVLKSSVQFRTQQYELNLNWSHEVGTNLFFFRRNFYSIGLEIDDNNKLITSLRLENKYKKLPRRNFCRQFTYQIANDFLRRFYYNGGPFCLKFDKILISISFSYLFFPICVKTDKTV